MNGQADRVLELRRMEQQGNAPAPANIVAFVSGKGGTGKSVLALNTAFFLSSQGKRVLLVDFDLHNPNLHIMCNIYPGATLRDYFDCRVLLDETIEKIDPNLFCIFGEQLPGGKVLTSQIKQLILALASISRQYDLILLDTGSGINESLALALPNISTAIVVANPEPTSVMDAYVMIKHLFQQENPVATRVVFNKCQTKEDGDTAYNNLMKALYHFIRKQIICPAIIPASEDVYRSIMNQELLLRGKQNHIITPHISALSAEITKIAQSANNSH